VQASPQRQHAAATSPFTLLSLLLGLRVVDVLLSQLGPERGDLVLQRGDLVVVFLFHSRHARLYIANVLPHIDLAAHDFAHATATSTVA